jgi:phosphoenolpyruvate carboxykinase (ATP)
MQIQGTPSTYGLEQHGLQNLKTIYWNLLPPALVEQIILRQEGDLAKLGSIVVWTGEHTGRSPKDKFVVRDPELENEAIWWGKVNQPISPEKFDQIYRKMVAYLQGRDVFVQDMQAGANPAYQVPIRIITEKAWASLFVHNLFIRLSPENLKNHNPEYVVIHCPDFQASAREDGVNSSTVILVNFSKKIVLIGGTNYAGEIKKSIFTVLNYVNPRRGVLSMHCSANVGPRKDVALFFGLSGTGKTTLSSDPERQLIGDDEHGWADDGVFNFEGGCYAKTIHLRPNLEPLIWEAACRFGTVLENVVLDPETRIVNFEDDRFTENTRAAYPIEYVPNFVKEGVSGHPDHIFFLTADAFGVLPPISRLTPDQAIYYFLSGYTSKIAGTELGLGAEPEATFSTCFGSPFLPLKPHLYADLLGQKIASHQVKVWLVNTGWTGGPYGVGERINLSYTRAMIRAALNNQIDDGQLCKDEFFGLRIPCEIPDVPETVLRPENTWVDKLAYRTQALELIARFEKNFDQFSEDVSAEVITAGPHIR